MGSSPPSSSSRIAGLHQSGRDQEGFCGDWGGDQMPSWWIFRPLISLPGVELPFFVEIEEVSTAFYSYQITRFFFRGFHLMWCKIFPEIFGKMLQTAAAQALYNATMAGPTGPTAAPEAPDMAPVCRICLDAEGALIQPCGCQGSMKCMRSAWRSGVITGGLPGRPSRS